MKSINVEGRIALMDDEDFERIRRHRWRLHSQGYAFRKTSRGRKTVTLWMHRVVMNAPPEMEVDHLHGLKLDNRKSELAIITPKAHRKKHASTLAAWQKAHQIYPDQKPCVVCGTVFKVNPPETKAPQMLLSCVRSNPACARTHSAGAIVPQVAAEFVTAWMEASNPTTTT